MRLISAAEIDAALDFPTIVAALREGHRRPSAIVNDTLLADPAGGSGRLLNRSAWAPGGALAVKLATIFPDNVAGDPPGPSVKGVVLVFDGAKGDAIAAMDGAAQTAWKTAGDSALGADILARRDARALLMVGAGAMAGPLIRAHRAMRPGLAEIAVWNRTPARADALVAALGREGIAARRVEDLEAATRAADIVSCAVMTEAPVMRGAWLKPGAHLDLVGAYTPTMRETDDEALRRGRLFVDSRKTTIGHIGEIEIPLKTGIITEADILADLYELCDGRVAGRRSDHEITIFKNGGGAHLDLMAAQAIVEAVSR